MKGLYEIQTGWTGESYVRAYCWAECEEDVREIFKAFQDNPEHRIEHIRLLFRADSAEFCSAPSDHGFETEGMIKFTDLHKLHSVKLSDIVKNHN